MHPFSILTLGIFVAGYTTARWDLVTRLYELAIFAWDNGVVTRSARGAIALTLLFAAIVIPVAFIATKETHLHPQKPGSSVSAREQLRRRGSF
ncbi:Putative Phosphatidylinositol n-acetylglucosaminyltransferase subunit gpi1 [[Torrubiella] hemipterigena]|uniref:Putative Phosphatidylinositol n-acetylglucosaminyltransferase subunit gpi1 n=1 Tax=[Torrubiella] hemipterigena TaxID=1531966 RepID=A0A0A1TI98_9HYPO|nr:Putative Phosphatidylinositol n-acetylglucosaminyltransferase subunit gpi1 [[Torrubiella] hemipterigena]